MPPSPREASTADATFNDPDLQNSEQNELGTQAQDVAEEALRVPIEDDPLESRPASKSGPADLVPRDVPDLVDNLKGMIRYGHIDMNAYDGESGMDDEDEEDADEL